MAINQNNQPLVPYISPLSGLTFPNDIANIGYYMQFQFKQYSRGLGGQVNSSGMGNINLPMPDRINDHQVMEWDTVSVSQEVSRAAGPMIEAANKALQTFGKVGNIAGSMGGVIDLATTVGGWATGLKINPFLIMMFKNPTFKEFDFSWDLYPRSPDESDTLNDIVKTFRKNMLPTSGSFGGIPLGPVVLNYPMIVQPTFFPNHYLFKFKNCAISDINVDYTAPGQPAFTVLTAPVGVKFTIHLKEIDLWFGDDPDLL